LAQALPQLTTEQIAQVSPRFIRETFAPGEAIIRQGDAPDRFYIVIRGQAEVLYEDLKGEIETVDRRKAGEYFGETGLIQNRPRSATVRASTEGEVEVLAMDRQDFQEMMAESKATEMHLAQEMIQRLIRLADAES
jgi:CRP/FNR family cyclic AMP-dependent transcriptional regulator